MPVGDVFQVFRKEYANSLADQIGQGLPCLVRLQSEGSVKIIVQGYRYRRAHADSLTF